MEVAFQEEFSHQFWRLVPLLGALVGVICVNLGLVSQEQFPIFVILGMSGYFGSNIQGSLNCYDTRN